MKLKVTGWKVGVPVDEREKMRCDLALGDWTSGGGAGLDECRT